MNTIELIQLQKRGTTKERRASMAEQARRFEMNEEQWLFVSRVHSLIPLDKQGPCNFLTLVCTGHTTGWAASFDFDLDAEWYEHIGDYPFAARAATAAEAIYKAAMLVRVIVLG